MPNRPIRRRPCPGLVQAGRRFLDGSAGALELIAEVADSAWLTGYVDIQCHGGECPRVWNVPALSASVFA